MQSTAGSLIVSSKKQKLVVINHPELGECLIVCGGINECIAAALRYLEKGGEKPTLDEFEAILITKNGRMFNVYTKHIFPILMPYEKTV